MDVQAVARFFTRVVHWPQANEPGVINLHYFTPNKHLFGRPFKVLTDFMNYAQWCNEHPDKAPEIYFCLSTQARVGTQIGKVYAALRNAQNALALKAIWLDVDVKAAPNGYPTLKEAIDALTEFVKATGLPGPTALVGSGGGLHVYWISDWPLTVADWEPYAEGLRALAEQHKLRCDLGVTIDPARILRVPGTYNRKGPKPRPVILHKLAENDIDFQAELSKFAKAPAGKATPEKLIMFDMSGPPPFTLDVDLKSDEYRAEIGEVNAGTDDLDALILVKDGGCPMFQQALLTGGEGLPQGLWMQQALSCTFMHRGREWFHKFSNKHATYSPEVADAMYDRKENERERDGLKWVHCDTFEKYGSKQCATCKHRGKIKTPLHLTRPFAAPSDFPEAPSAEIQEAAAELCLPPGYHLDGKGYISKIVKKQVGKATHDEEINLFQKCKITEPFVNPEGTVLSFTAQTGDLEKPRQISVEVKDIHSGVLWSILGAQGVQPNPEYKAEAAKFMSLFVTELRGKGRAMETVAYGWKEDFSGFAYDGYVYQLDGKTTPAATGDPVTRKHYTVQGAQEPWFDALKVITDQHRPALEAIVAISFAAPLIALTGQSGATFSALGPTTANKSSAVKVGLAVWGHPVKTKRSPGTSANSLLATAGELRNLPLYWDDIREESQMQNLQKVLNEITENVTAGKLNADRSQRETPTWNTILCVSSNVSLFERVLRESKTDSAQPHRVFQIEVAKHTEATPGRLEEWEATPIFDALQQNYGHLGHKYSVILGRTMKDVIQELKDMQTKIGARINFRSEERFWLAMVACLLVGAQKAHDIWQAPFNMQELEDFLCSEYLKNRERIDGADLEGGSEANTRAVLSQFFKDQGDNTIRTANIAPAGRSSADKVGYISGPHRRDTPINVQWALQQKILRISRPALTKYLTENGYDPSMVIRGLRDQLGALPKKNVNLTTGTIHGNSGSEAILQIEYGNYPWLCEIAAAYIPGPAAQMAMEDKDAAT